MKAALLVVDADEVTLGRLAARGERAAEVAARLVEVARGHAVPVLHSRLRFRADGLDGGHWFRRDPALAAYAGTIVEPVPSLAARADELVMHRSFPSPFFGTSLSATLRGAAVDTVLLVGATTSGSIRAAALDALQHGFLPLVVDAAVTDTPDAHDAALRDVTRYADVVTPNRVLDLLTRRTPIPPRRS